MARPTLKVRMRDIEEPAFWEHIHALQDLGLIIDTFQWVTIKKGELNVRHSGKIKKISKD